MSASWAAAVVPLLVALVGGLGWVGGYLVRTGRREGKLDEVLRQMAQTLGDHEQRLRKGRL